MRRTDQIGLSEIPGRFVRSVCIPSETSVDLLRATVRVASGFIVYRWRTATARRGGNQCQHAADKKEECDRQLSSRVHNKSPVVCLPASFQHTANVAAMAKPSVTSPARRQLGCPQVRRVVRGRIEQTAYARHTVRHWIYTHAPV